MRRMRHLLVLLLLFGCADRSTDVESRLLAIDQTRRDIQADRLRRLANAQASAIEVPMLATDPEMRRISREAEEVIRGAEDQLLRELDRQERQLRAP